MKVSLINNSPNALETIWMAARTCKSEEIPKDALTGTYGDRKRLVKALWRMGHKSVFEHVLLTYAIEGMSRTCLAQYSRHRIGVSLSVQSQRYVDITMENDGAECLPVVVPSSIEDNERANEVFLNILDSVEEGCKELKWLGIPKEDVRFAYPEGTMTNMVTSVNLRSLGDLYQKRVKAPGAQWEIKGMVQEMVERAFDVMPWYWECLEAE